jgi:cobalamin synthase
LATGIRQGHRRHSTMNALTASSIVALVGATAFIVVAVITAPARIGLLPAIAIRNPSNPYHVPIDLPESAKKFRVLGWMLVLLLYLAATFCLLQGLNDLRIYFHWEQWEAYFGNQLSDQAEIALYSRFWIAMSIVLIFIGFWAQRRLRRRLK